MIRCLLVHVARNRLGQPIRTERLVVGDTLHVGRGAECAIHLPDHRVRLHHAFIHAAEDGKYYIEGDGTRVSVNGVFHQAAELTPGTRVSVGPYELVAESPSGDGELVIAVELVHPRPTDEAILTRAPASLAAAGLSKRRPALWLAGTITLLFLLLPLLQATRPALGGVLAELPLTPMQTWNPGPLLAGHQAFAKQCDKCHRQPFAPVADQACASCHRDTAPHAPTTPQPRCVACHRDHKGENGLVRGDAPLCVSCHGRIKEHSAATTLANVQSFATDHAEFRLSFARTPEQEHARRVRQSDKNALTEASGLKFSHQVHAGKVRQPSDPRVFRTMSCADCHTPDSGGKRFKPVTMKDHCFECHREEFDFNPPQNDYRLPHGSERALMDVLEQFHLKKAIDADAARSGRAPVARALETAAASARKTATALAGEMGCGLCHEIESAAADAVPWRVKPVAVTQHWLPAARFTHAKHRAGECTECHDVGRSRQSADVALPAIGKCRACHGGEAAADDKVASPCAACHVFHAARAGR